MLKRTIPYTWADTEIEARFNSEFIKWNLKKKFVAHSAGILDKEAVQTDLAQVTIPEIMSAEISRLSGKNHLEETAATLQAYQTYSLSLYDIIND